MGGSTTPSLTVHQRSPELPSALISGPARRVADLTEAVHAAGFRALTLPAGLPLDEAYAKLPPGSTVLVVVKEADDAPSVVTPSPPPVDGFADLEPDLSYADWRREIMSLTDR